MRRTIRASVIGGTGAGICYNLQDTSCDDAVIVDAQALIALMEPEEDFQECRSIEGAMKRVRRDILTDAVHKLQSGECKDAVDALRRVCSELEGILLSARNPILAQRAADIRSQTEYLVRRLMKLPEIEIGTNTVLVSAEIGVQEALIAAKAGVAAAIVSVYNPFSHAALILRGASIPVAYGVGNLGFFNDGCAVRVDGEKQRIVVEANPDEMEINREEFQVGAEHIRLRDGSEFLLRLNAMGSFENLPAGMGIGLLRTEFFCMSDASPIDEERLAAEYSALICRHGEVSIRLPDVRDDKPVPGLVIGKGSSKLGLCGIRALLKNDKYLKTHLRAILRASAGRRARILIPMVTEVWEVQAVRNMLEACAEELRSANIPIPDRVELGAMIETPSAAIEAEQLAEITDFAALGTNDLTQYVMAADRDDDEIAAYAHWNKPAVLKLMRYVLKAFMGRNKRICVCGEMAAEAEGIAALVEMGFREASVVPSRHGAIASEIEKL